MIRFYDFYKHTRIHTDIHTVVIKYVYYKYILYI